MPIDNDQSPNEEEPSVGVSGELSEREDVVPDSVEVTLPSLLQQMTDTPEPAATPWFEVDPTEISDTEYDSEVEQIVLDPEHPLMVRFQDALGTHLNKRLAELDLEHRDLKLKLVASKNEREALGMTLYSEQQGLALRQARLESLQQDAQVHTAQRLCRETEIQAIRKLYRTAANQADEVRDHANEMQKELDNLNLRVFYLMSSHEDVRSDVKVMKRAALKTRQDLAVEEESKQKQDYRVDLLVELIDQKKTDVEMFKTQVVAQLAETLKYKDLLAEADAELELLQADVKQIHSNWKSTLLGMKRRDESLAAMLERLRDGERTLLCKTKEIEAYKRNILQSEEKHERFSYMLSRVLNDMATSEKAITKSRNKFAELTVVFSQKAKVLRSVEETIALASISRKEKQRELLSLRREYEQMVQTRNRMKGELIDTLQSHSAYTKAAEYSKKTALDVIRLISNLEGDLSSEENMLANLEQDLIAVQSCIASNDDVLAVVTEEIRERNELVTRYETSFNKNHNTVERKQNYMDDCNRKLGALLEKSDGNEVSPLENLVLNLNKALRKESNRMLEDQTMWVERQQEFLNLIQEKHDYSLSIRHRYQDTLVLNGRKHRLDVAIEKQTEEEIYYKVDMRRLRVEMEKLVTLVHGKKGQKDEMEASSYVLETEFIRELKEMEVNALKMQDKLHNIGSEKEALLNQLVQHETQISWWDRKIQLGIEMKAAVDPKNNENADVHAMKSEIHRMNLRYQRLMKEQERFIGSMEDSVTRREYTVYGYKAVVRRDPDVLTKSKCRRRILEAKGKISHFKKELTGMDQERKDLHGKSVVVGRELNEKKAKILQTKDNLNDVENAVQAAAAEKLKNFLEVVARQKRSAHYAKLKAGKYSVLCKEPSQLDVELQKEQDKMRRLIEVTTLLKEKFPKAQGSLDRVISAYGFASGNEHGN